MKAVFFMAGWSCFVPVGGSQQCVLHRAGASKQTRWYCPPGSV